MTGPLLEVRDLTVGYSRAPVLRDVSLDVDENEVVGLVGANGAGKTTLLRALTGTLAPWSGEVVFAGTQLAALRPWRRVQLGLSHVPEGRRIFGAMTVEENLEVARVALRAKRQRFEQIYSVFPRLAERRTQVAGSLSGGEQQMLAIGRAVMQQPRLMLVDELSVGLAPVTAQTVVASLKDIAAEGTAILVVEQSPHLIASLVDRVVLLSRGAVAATGDLDEMGGADAVAELYLGVR